MESIRRLRLEERRRIRSERGAERDIEGVLGLRYRRGELVYDRVTGERGVIEASARGAISADRGT